MLAHLELVVVALLQILTLLPHIGSGDNIGLASGLTMMMKIPRRFLDIGPTIAKCHLIYTLKNLQT